MRFNYNYNIKIRCVFLVCAVHLWILLSGAHAEPVVLAEVSGSVPLAGHIELLHDISGRLTCQDVSSDRYKDSFKAITGNIATGFTQGAVWARFTLFPRTDAPLVWLLEIDPAINESLQLYAPDTRNRYFAQYNWNLITTAEDHTAYRNPVFKLQIQPGKPQTLYLRISSKRAIIAKPIIWQPELFHRMTVRVSLFHGFYVGCSIIVIAINFIFWLRLRNNVYLYYFIYVTGLLIIFTEAHGYLSQFVLDDHALSTSILRLGLSIVIASGPGFMSELLQLNKYLPRIDKYLRCTSFLVACVAIVLSFTSMRYQIGKILYVCVFISALSSICIGSYLSVKNTPLARLYLLAFVPTLVIGIYSALMNLGVVSAYSGTSCLMLVTTIFHMILLNLAVADRVGRVQAEKAEIEAALAAERQTVDQQCQFVRLVSHELRNPLAIIDSTIHVLPLLLDDPSHLSRKAEALKAAARRMNTLLYGCLNVERLALEGLKPEFALTDVRELILSICRYTQSNSSNHQIHVDLSADLNFYRCDAMLVEVLLGNLLDNAVKYSPAGGAISVRAWLNQHGHLYAEVKDSGVGISPVEIDSIFGRFYRAGHLPDVSGFGLGLYLARQIAEMHGGAISCSSVCGQGSAFTVWMSTGCQ